jgi:uncharacterized protein (DUF1800 family)
MPRFLDHPAVRGAVAAVLCAQLAIPAGIGAQEMSSPQTHGTTAQNLRGRTPIDPPPPEDLQSRTAKLKGAAGERLTGDARILLVLDRFTYGPRPGDLARVREIGLNEWFKQQLNPSTIDDSALNARLDNYPAMKLPLDRMMVQFPPNNEVRRVAKGYGDATPPDGPNRAVFNDRVAAAREKYKTDGDTAKKSKAAPPVTAPDDSAMASSTAKADTPDKKARKHDDLRAETAGVSLPKTIDEIYAMNPDDRFKLITSLHPAQMYELRRQSRDMGQLTAGFNPSQMETMASFSSPEAVIANEEVQSKLLRDIYSERQLNEVMVDFWLNHFNLYMKKNQEAPYMIAAFERDTIRPRALGHFEDLLLATAASPAMLQYLDQDKSIGPHSASVHPSLDAYSRGAPAPKKAKDSGLNENYAREVMELHTVGVDAGYTQKDVTEMAKVLTGWTVDSGRKSGEPTQVVFDGRKHEPGTKVVMGQTIKEDGLNEGVKMLKFLAESPQCAHFISEKLAVRFVSDNPPKAMVDRMAGTFLETRGDIRQVLVTMVNSPEFFTAGTYRTKVKTPLDFVVSAVRATDADVQNPSALAKTIADLGMPMFGHQTPDGYSMQSSAWNSTTALIDRMNFSMALASNRIQGVHTNLDTLLGPSAATMSPKLKQDDLESRLLHAPVSARTESLIGKETALAQDQQVAQLKQVSAIRGGYKSSKGGGKKSEKEETRDDRSTGANGELAQMDTQAAMAAGLVLGSPEFPRR